MKKLSRYKIIRRKNTRDPNSHSWIVAARVNGENRLFYLGGTDATLKEAKARLKELDETVQICAKRGCDRLITTDREFCGQHAPFVEVRDRTFCPFATMPPPKRAT